MDFKQLAYFVEIAERGTFSAAARKIYISQSALSKAIKSLSDSLGVRLFYTENNRSLLTKEGEILYTQAKKILRECDITLQLLEQTKQTVMGTVRVVTSFQRENLKWLTQLITEFSQQNESAVVNLSVKGSHDAKKDLESGAADIGIFIDNETVSDTFDSVILGYGHYYILANKEHPLARLSSICFKDLNGYDLVTYPPGFAIHSALIDGCRNQGFDPNIRMTSPQPNVLFAGVEQNLGMTMVAIPPTQQEVNNNVVCIPLNEPDLTFSTVAIKFSNQYQQPAVEHFWSFVKQCAQKNFP